MQNYFGYLSLKMTVSAVKKKQNEISCSSINGRGAYFLKMTDECALFTAPKKIMSLPSWRYNNNKTQHLALTKTSFYSTWERMVVYWSVWSPSSPMMWLKIPVKSKVLALKCWLKKNECKNKEAGVGPFKNF